MKIVQKDDTVSSMEDSQQLLDSEDEKQAETDVEIQSQNMPTETYNPWKKSQLQQDIDREILKALRSSNSGPDGDEAFSFQLFQLYEECLKRKNWTFVCVLQLIKDINNRRKERPVFETFSSASTSTSRTTTPLSSLGAIMDANQVSQLPHLLQADQFSYHPECNSSSNVETQQLQATLSSLFEIYFVLISLHVLWSVNK